VKLTKHDNGFYTVNFTPAELDKWLDEQHRARTLIRHAASVMDYQGYVSANAGGYVMFDQQGRVRDGTAIAASIAGTTPYTLWTTKLRLWARRRLSQVDQVRRALRRTVLGEFTRSDNQADGLVKRRDHVVRVLGDGSHETITTEWLVPLPGNPTPKRRNRQFTAREGGSKALGTETLASYANPRSGWRRIGRGKAVSA
jgi:hypothetical protein